MQRGSSLQHAACVCSNNNSTLSFCPSPSAPLTLSLSVGASSIAGIICNEIILFALRNGLHSSPAPFLKLASHRFNQFTIAVSVYLYVCVCDSTSHLFNIDREWNNYYTS